MLTTGPTSSTTWMHGATSFSLSWVKILHLCVTQLIKHLNAMVLRTGGFAEEQRLLKFGLYVGLGTIIAKVVNLRPLFLGKRKLTNSS